VPSQENRIGVSCISIPCSVAVGYQRPEGPWCLHLQGSKSFVMLASCRNTARHHNSETWTRILAAVKTSNLETGGR